MARLEERDGDRWVVLGERVVVGRSEACDWRLDADEVSAEHVVLRWSADGWTLRDLASSNGTSVDDQRVEPGAWVPLREGATVAIGDQTFVLADASPPGPEAVVGDTVHHALDGILALPSVDEPEVLVLRRDDDRWVARREDEDDQDAALLDGPEATVTVGEGVVTVRLPVGGGSLPRTAAAEARPLVLSGLTLRFDVSLDQEYIDVSLVMPEQSIALPSRACHELLWVLARARLEDEDLPPEERGWRYTQDVSGMTGRTLQQLNLDVFRARRLLRDVGVIDAEGIVERRTTTHQLRIGGGAVEIHDPSG